MAIWKMMEPRPCTYNKQQATIIARYLKPSKPNEPLTSDTVAISINGKVFYYIDEKSLN